MEFNIKNQSSMILVSENKILTVNGKVLQRKVNTLYFETSGEQFPKSNSINQNDAFFQIDTLDAQKIIINYGDGIIETHSKSDVVGRTALAWTKKGETVAGMSDVRNIIQPHTYLDGNIDKRVISIKFEDLSKLTSLRANSILLYGSLTPDILYATELNILYIKGTRNLTSFPLNLMTLSKLRDIILIDVMPTILMKIPESFFHLKLSRFTASGLFDCSDMIASNLFKLNQWSTTLTILDLSMNNIIDLDDTFSELTKLTDLRINNTNNSSLIRNPPGIENFSNLTVLYTYLTELFNCDKLDKLKTFVIANPTLDISNLAVLWRGLKSLNQVGSMVNFIGSTARFDQFIDQFYILCTTNGNILPNASPAPYPNRFRNIAWGGGTLSFTGAKVAPTGYVQGVSNGTPINQGQKIYVLQNQYNHVITHA